MLFATSVLQGSGHSLLRVMDIPGDEIRQLGMPGVVPNHFHRVQFRDITGKPLHFEPVAAGGLQQVDGLAMGTVATHDRISLRHMCQ